MTATDWRAGTGYPSPGASVDIWEYEFLSRGEQGLKGRPHFKLQEGGIEFFCGPAMIQINDDGSLSPNENDRRSTSSHMVIEFMLDQDIDAQIEIAKRWLTANQQHRFKVEKQRMREEKFSLYLRALDAHGEGETHDEIARVLYPWHSNCYPSHLGRKQANKAITAAKKLASRGLRKTLDRR